MAQASARQHSTLPFFQSKKKSLLKVDVYYGAFKSLLGIPKSLQDRMLQTLHQNHPEVTTMKSIARSYMW